VKHFLSKLVQYIRKTYISHWVVLGVDIAIAALCSFFTYFFLYYAVNIELNTTTLLAIICVSVLSIALGSFIFNTFRNIIRYSRAKDLWRVICCVIFKSLFIAIVVLAISSSKDWPGRQNIIFIIFDGTLTFICMVGIRIVMIVVYEFLLKMEKKSVMRILIYGLDEKSVALEGRLQNSAYYKVIGFYTDSSSNSSKSLSGFPIYTSNSEIAFGTLVENKNIQGLLFSRVEDIRKEENSLLKYCKNNRIRTMIAPSISDTQEVGESYQSVRPIRIEDLLGREEININMQEVISEFKENVVLVTGAAGSIGSELCRQLAQIGVKRLLMFDSSETPMYNILLEFRKKFSELDFVTIIGDVRDQRRLQMVFERYCPQIVIHAAAYKHVPLMEENPCEAVMVNTIGTCKLADVAVKFGAKKMIMVSTDKAVNPTNVMGASKRLAEIYIQSLGYAMKEGKISGNTQFMTTRFGNVLGSNGSVIHLFKEQIENGGPLTVTHPDIIRYFMTIPEACRLVLEAATMGNGNEVFVFEMGNPVKIVDLAKKMIELAGYRPGYDIEIAFTGLRPGEKLYEELLSTEEGTLPTTNNKIHIAKVRRYEYAFIKENFVKLEELSHDVDIIQTVSLMKKIVPEFLSQNSKFEELDK